MDSSEPTTIPMPPTRSLRRRQWLQGTSGVALLWLGMVVACAAPTDGPDEAVLELQHEWELIRFRAPVSDRIGRFEALAGKAHRVTQLYPQVTAVLIWEAVIVSSWAEAKDDLGSLDLARRAKALFEAALKIDAMALGGGAYTGLAALHYKLPSWPLSFGDENKARELLQRALAINPHSIDANYYYGELMVETRRPQEAVAYLERVLQAPARPGREVSDGGRRDEAQALLHKIKAR